MAIIKSTAIGKAKGSLGNLTYRYLSGDTIASGKVAFPKIPRTFAQMIRRIGWANLVNFYQTFNEDLHPSFEQAQGRVSDYNLFIGRNNGRAPYLTKKEASAGGCIVAPYQITEGSLRSINVSTTEAGAITSDINVGSLVINEETTLSAFSAAIRANNTGWQYGDQLTAFISIQSVDTVTLVPRVVTRAYEITLAEDSETLLVDLLGNNNECFAVTAGKLAFAQVINGGGCYVHSRIDADGNTLVSTQAYVVTNDLLATYSTETMAIAAITSYGGNTRAAFLTPNITTPLAPTPNP